jgi:hypothetical protein
MALKICSRHYKVKKCKGLFHAVEKKNIRSPCQDSDLCHCETVSGCYKHLHKGEGTLCTLPFVIVKHGKSITLIFLLLAAF